VLMSADNGQGQPDGSNEAGAQVRGSTAEPRSGAGYLQARCHPASPAAAAAGRARERAPFPWHRGSVLRPAWVCAEAGMGLC